MAENNPQHDRPDDSSPLNRLIAGYMDGELSEEELAELERRLEDDEQARSEYLRMLSVHSGLAWHSRRSTPTVDEGEGFLLRHAQVGSATLSDERKRTSRSFSSIFAANSKLLSWVVAACMVPIVVAFLWPGGDAPPANDPPEYVVTVAGLERCVWGRGDLGGSRRLEAGRSIELLQGRADLTFETGVHLAVVGPASLSIVSEGEADLAWGQLVAEVPPNAEDFVIKTPHAMIDQPGTRFGVETTPNVTEVHSLLGDSLVRPAMFRKDTNFDKPGPSKILAGTSARFTRDDPSPANGIAEPDEFPNLAEGPTKVLQIRGPVEFLDRAPTSIGPCSLESDDVAYLLPERVDTVIATLTLVTFVEPGRHSVYREPWPAIEPGTHVDSYLLAFNPVGTAKRDATTGIPPARKSGEITFNRPILGVIAHKDHLERTDEYPRRDWH